MRRRAERTTATPPPERWALRRVGPGPLPPNVPLLERNCPTTGGSARDWPFQRAAKGPIAGNCTNNDPLTERLTPRPDAGEHAVPPSPARVHQTPQSNTTNQAAAQQTPWSTR